MTVLQLKVLSWALGLVLLTGCMDSDMEGRGGSGQASPPGPEVERDGERQDETGSDSRLRRGIMPTTPENLYPIFQRSQNRLPSGIFQGRSNLEGPCLVKVKYNLTPPLWWQVTLEYLPPNEREPILLEFELLSREDLVTQMIIGDERIDVLSWEVDLGENKMANQKHLSILEQVPGQGSSVHIYDKQRSDQKKISLITCYF